MLTTRIIPVLLLYHGRMVKTKQFQAMRDVGNPKTAVRIYNAQDVDELMFLDISATQEGRPTLCNFISEVSEECFVPLVTGGGVKTIEDVRSLLRSGADMVVINTQAFLTPTLISESAIKFGSQAVAVSVDVKNGTVWINRATVDTGVSPEEWIAKAVEFGAGEIVLTAVEREGMMGGYDYDLIQKISSRLPIPLVANGGAGNLQHMVEAVDSGADAVAASSIFHFTDQSPIKARSYLSDKNILVRMV